MRRLVHEHATTFAIPTAAPGGRAVIGASPQPGFQHQYADQFSEFTGCKHAFDVFDGWPCPVLKTDGENSPGLVRSSNESIGFSNFDSDGVLGQNVITSFESIDGHRDV